MTVECQSIGGAGYHIEPEELAGFVRDNLARLELEGKSVCLIIPDDTRSCPLPQLLTEVYRNTVDRAANLTCIIALGTHAYMEPDEIARWTTGDAAADVTAVYPGMTILNHEWHDEDKLVNVGHIAAERINELSGGRLAVGSDVLINRHVVEADVKIIIGPILPHEVVGISGGNKYFIPGCAKEDLIDLTHWVGALITASEIIGAPGVTPVRAMINEGAAMIPGEHYCLAFVVKAHTLDLESASFGDPQDAWAEQGKVTAQTHVEYVDELFDTVIAEIPERYHDIWTAAKGFYKTEPAVRDGGEVIIYAPHITEVSEAHHEIYDIGYHCRDYFVKQWDRFKEVPWGVLAHSTHMRGLGTYDPQTGIEEDRINVTLATGISKEICDQINVGYLDPATIDLAAEAGKPNVTVVHDAGEVLFRPAAQRPQN
ncbi:lactate racemase domain-containing protein [Granulicoccus phenolivorans]|uniref:lactate racemase domain-containing protein n=1 Tax=Granulicoccus phenolivorans TaxID=266854 RepID=UPI00040B54FF|nr:lactate racemase domain-containing protein [Granulicoccus phenolivorans]